MPRPYYILPIAVILISSLPACGSDNQVPVSTSLALPTTTIAFTDSTGGQVELLVEIAGTREERARGLMFRESLPENQGMLFDFGGVEAQRGFWMKDTTIPLSIAFISVDLIIDIQDMEPLSLELHYAPDPYAFAVEVNQGWFERNAIGVGGDVRLIFR